MSPFDFVLLCHSVPLDRAEDIRRLLHSRNRRIVAFRLTSMYSEPAPDFDVTCAVQNGPLPLLKELDKLSRVSRAAK